MANFYLGKAPAENNVTFKFDNFVNVKELAPTVPTMFGHHWGIGPDWGMFGNDQCGNCVWCAYAHDEMIWNNEAKKKVSFTTDNVKSDYSAQTGYRGTPDTDNGTSMSAASKYRRQIGIIDSSGIRHKIDSYTALHLGDNMIKEIVTGAFYFGCFDIGIQLPKSAMDQFLNDKPWDVVRNTSNEGGHCITIVGRNSKGLLLAVTWGKLVGITPAFLREYVDEGQCSLSKEPLIPLSPEKFDYNALQNKLAAL